VQKSDKQNATFLADRATFKARQRCISDRSGLLLGLLQQTAYNRIFSSGHTLITQIPCIIIGMLGNIRL
jgi:hypothetical protein